MKRLTILILGFVFLISCATTQSQVEVKTHPGKKLALPENQVQIIAIYHFITFKCIPEGVEVAIVNTLTGKESVAIGTTPVRVLVLKKVLQFSDGKVEKIGGIEPIGDAISYGNGVKGGLEFQFKFKKPGYSDQMMIERIPYLLGSSEKEVKISLTKE